MELLEGGRAVACVAVLAALAACGSSATEVAPAAGDEGGTCSTDACASSSGDPQASSTESDASTGAATEADSEDRDDGSTSGPDAQGSTGMVTTPRVCYPGAIDQGDTCFDLVEVSPYDYPSADVGLVAPTHFLDLDALDLETWVSPNFQLWEFCDRSLGRYQVLQPDALRELQAVRDQVGGIGVRLGFRPPQPGEIPSTQPDARHMYGLAFDLVALESTQDALREACLSRGATTATLAPNGDIQCDWFSVPPDPAFYGG